MIALVWCLRVNDCDVSDLIELPELQSVSCGGGGLCFIEDASSTLIMRSDEMNEN